MTMFPSSTQAADRRIRPLPALALLALLLAPPAAGAAVLSEDPGDQTYLTIAINEALETRKTDVEIPLRNPDTGSQGTLVIERTYYRDPTTPCRDYRRVIERAGTPLSEVRGTGCRIGKALWSLDEAKVAPTRGSSPPPKRNGPVSLNPSAPAAGPAPAPAAKPPAEGRAAAGGGSRAAASPPPASDAPPPVPPVPAYTLPSRADL